MPLSTEASSFALPIIGLRTFGSSTHDTRFEPEFVLRIDEFNEVRDALTFFRKSKAVKLTGQPGVGKTWLARSLGMYLRAFGLYDGSFYARTDQLNAASLRSLAQQLGQYKQILVVVDQADAHPRYAHDVVRVSPPNAHVLIVGRDVSRIEVHSPTISLGGLTLSETSELAEKVLGRQATGLEVEQLHARYQGNAALVALALKAYKNGVGSWSDILGQKSLLAFAGPFGPDGVLLDSQSGWYRTIVTDVRTVSVSVLKELAAKPEELYRVSSRFFEEVVTEIFRRKGYEVTLTPPSRDGGKDIYAVRRDSVGTFLVLIECKQYGPSHKVGVELVRSLYGVVEHEKASAGILATTSYFTHGATEFQHRVKFRMSLQDFLGLQNLLKEVTGL